MERVKCHNIFLFFLFSLFFLCISLLSFSIHLTSSLTCVDRAFLRLLPYHLSLAATRLFVRPMASRGPTSSHTRCLATWTRRASLRKRTTQRHVGAASPPIISVRASHLRPSMHGYTAIRPVSFASRRAYTRASSRGQSRRGCAGATHAR